MRHDAGSLTIPKTSHLPERQKDESPARMFGISESVVHPSENEIPCYNHSLLPSLPFLPFIPSLSSQPSLVPCTNCFSFTLGHTSLFQHTQKKDHLQVMPRSLPASYDRSPDRRRSLGSTSHGSLTPPHPAEYLAPNIDYVHRPVARPSLNRATVVSAASHMQRYPPSASSIGTMNINIGNPNSERGQRISTEDNIPSRFDAFLLGDGEKKVTEEPDTRESRL